MGLADLHIHTIYSYDGTASVPAVLTQAKQTGLDVIAITDHDEIKGALKAFELALNKEFGKMVSFKNNSITAVTLEEATQQHRLVDKNSSLVHAARGLGISFGD